MKKLMVLLSFVLSGCTSPLWWYEPGYVTIYKGVPIFVASQATVTASCENPIALGCTQVYNYHWANAEGPIFKQRPRFAYSVNNPAVLMHECAHIDALVDRGSTLVDEQLKDLITAPLNTLMTVLTLPFPASKDKPCGDGGTMAEFKAGKWLIYQRYYGDVAILPTPVEVAAGAPIPFKK